MQRHHIFVLLEDEIIVKEFYDDISKEDLKYIFGSSFNENISYFELIGKRLYQIHKGKDKQFGPVNYMDYEIGFYYICEKYPKFLESKEFGLVMKEHMCHYDEYNDSVEYVKSLTSKPITIDKWKYKIHWETLEAFIKTVDKTHNQKYLNWICNIEYIKNGILGEDYGKISDLLIDFDNPQVKALIKKAGYSVDIMSYEDNNKLWKVINEVYYEMLSDIEAKDRSILYDKRKVFENNEWLVVVPANHQEAVTLGRNTNWCTSADSDAGAENFLLYTSDDFGNHYELFIFINKQDQKKKYQFSANGSESFLDAADEDFEVVEFFSPEMAEEYHDKMKLVPWQFKEILYLNNKEKYLNYIIYVENDATAFEDKKELIKKGLLLDVLVNDKSTQVKIELVKNGYFLDKFKDAPHYLLRQNVAKKGYALDELAEDAAGLVRAEVARQGYNIENFLNDDDKTVRSIAKHFWNLFVLNKIFFTTNEYGFKVLDIENAFKGEIYID